MEISNSIVTKLLEGVEVEVISESIMSLQEVLYSEDTIEELWSLIDRKMIGLFGTTEANPVIVYAELVACGLVKLEPELSYNADDRIRRAMKYIPKGEVGNIASKYMKMHALAEACQLEYDWIFRINKNGCEELLDLGFHDAEGNLIYPSFLVRETNALDSWYFLLLVDEKCLAFLMERSKMVSGPDHAYDIWSKNFLKRDEK